MIGYLPQLPDVGKVPGWISDRISYEKVPL